MNADSAKDASPHRALGYGSLALERYPVPPLHMQRQPCCCATGRRPLHPSRPAHTFPRVLPTGLTVTWRDLLHMRRFTMTHGRTRARFHWRSADRTGMKFLTEQAHRSCLLSVSNALTTTKTSNQPGYSRTRASLDDQRSTLSQQVAGVTTYLTASRKLQRLSVRRRSDGDQTAIQSSAITGADALSDAAVGGFCRRSSGVLVVS